MDRARGDPTAIAPWVDPPRERTGKPRREVPAPARLRALARRRRARGHGGADAARAADSREKSQRTERLHSFGQGEVDETLERLAGRELVARRASRPGQRGERYVQLLSEEGEATPSAPEPARFDISPSLEQRVAAIEAELERIRELLG